MRMHTRGMCAHARCMRVHTRVCVYILKVYLVHFLYQKHPSSQSFKRSGPKSILGLWVMSLLGNKGSSRKRYKMRVYSCPFFDLWVPLMKSKEKRDGKKNFNIQLKPNQHTWQTTCIHGAGCIPKELCGIHISEIPHVLLRKRTTIGSLSMVSICGSYLKLLRVDFVFVSIYSTLGGKFLCFNIFYILGVYVYMFNFQDGYVLKFCCLPSWYQKFLKTCAYMFNSRGIFA